MQDITQIIETPVDPEDEEQVNKTLDSIRNQVCRFLDVFTSIIPALFVNVLRKGK